MRGTRSIRVGALGSRTIGVIAIAAALLALAPTAALARPGAPVSAALNNYVVALGGRGHVF